LRFARLTAAPPNVQSRASRRGAGHRPTLTDRRLK
jgi:hypothetical protein